MSPFELREGVLLLELETEWQMESPACGLYGTYRRHFSNTFGADVSLARLLRIDRRLFDQPIAMIRNQVVENTRCGE